MSNKKELILCFNKKQALSLMKDTSGDAEEFLKHSHHLDQYFIPRYVAETSDTLVHPIPYYLVLNEKKEVLLYQRGKGVGESRLVGNYSVGIGGHVSDTEAYIEHISGTLYSNKECIYNTAWIEAKEELDAEYSSDFENLDIIYDDSDEVGAVHLGVCAKIHVTYAEFKEDELIDCGFHSKDVILAMHNNGEIVLENWSLLLLDML